MSMRESGRQFLVLKCVMGLLLIGLATTLTAQSSLGAPENPSAANTVTSGLSAQDAFASENVFAPFVSRLRVAVKEPQIRLTWRDIPNFKGSYVIYRHSAEISLENFDKATLVTEVESGEEFYTDVPPNSGEYFYAVLAKDEQGSIFKIFIPFRNKTLQAIAVNAAPQDKDLASEVVDFQAALWGSAIQVSLSNSRNTRTVAIFRSTKPMKGPDDLSSATQVWSGTGRQISYPDYAVPGVPYYYAAVDIEALHLGIAKVELGRNSLIKPIEIPLGNRKSIITGLNTPRTVRVMPLPILTLPDLNDQQPVLEGTNPIQVTTPLDPKTKATLVKLSSGLHTGAMAKAKPAELLPSDRLQLEGKLSSPIMGEAKALTEILDKNFSKLNWDESSRQLNNFLSLSLSRELAAKGHFYLAQAYYQTKHYREALLEFLFVQDELPEYAQPWIDNTLQLSTVW